MGDIYALGFGTTDVNSKYYAAMEAASQLKKT